MRTSANAVAGIIEVDQSISLTPFIEVANDLVTEKCTGSGYTEAKLELIERWLSAHFYAIRDQRTASEGAGPVSQSFQHAVALGLNQTIYGQQAMLIDTAGNLAGLQRTSQSGVRPTIGVTWLGKDPET